MQWLLAQQDTVKIPAVQIISAKITKSVYPVDFSGGRVFLSAVRPDFYLRDYDGEMSFLSVRGFKSSHTRVMLWNVPLLPSLSGSTDFTLLPYSLFDALKVQTSYSSVFSTAGGLGSTVDFYTSPQQGNFFTWQMNFSSLRGLASVVKYSLDTGHTRVIFRSLLEYSLNNYRYIDRFIPGHPLRRRQNAFLGKKAFMLSLQHNLSADLRMEINVLNSDVFRNFPPPVSYSGTPRIEAQPYSFSFFSCSLRGKNDFFSYDFTYARQNDFSAYTIFTSDTLPQKILDNSSSASSDYFSLILHKSVFAVKTVVEWQRFDFKEDIPLASGFNVRRFNKDVVFSIGPLRYGKFVLSTNHRMEAVDSLAYYLFDYSLEYKGRINVMLDAGRNVNIPSLNDLYWRPGGNPYLKPEIASQIEVKGYTNIMPSRFCKNIYLIAGGHYARVKNWIVWKPAQYHYWTAQNISEVSNWGLNVNAKFYFYSDFFRKFSLSYAFARVSDSTGIQIIYVPQHKLTGDFAFDMMGYDLSLSFLAESRRLILMHNPDFFLHPYWIWNLKIAKRWNYRKFDLSVYVNINNLFDKYYEFVVNRPAPLRYITISVKFNIK